jgi:RimJ/RimL family protein N-acetyltransferase
MTLRPMDETHLETARCWRNAPHVRAHMAYQEEISPELHMAWWRGLDPEHNRYWIFSREGHDMGMVHLKDIDPARRTAEAGVWTAEQELMGSPWPVMAVLAMMEHAFTHLGLFTLTAKLRGDHTPIVEFNRALGYRDMRNADDAFVWMTVTAEQFWEASARLRGAAERLI